MSAGGSITLGDVAELAPTLRVACTRCDRVGQYRLDSLIAQHGSRFGIPWLLEMLAKDCPKHGTGSFTTSVASIVLSFRRCF